MISLENIVIEAPKVDDLNENLYKFDLLTISGDHVTYKSECLYDIKMDEGGKEQMLKIPSKDELRNLSNVYTILKSKFLHKHEEWFENKITDSALDDLFKNFLQPNIVDNCIDLKVSITSDVMNNLKKVSNEQSNISNVFPIFSKTGKLVYVCTGICVCCCICMCMCIGMCVYVHLHVYMYGCCECNCM